MFSDDNYALCSSPQRLLFADLSSVTSDSLSGADLSEQSILSSTSYFVISV